MLASRLRGGDGLRCVRLPLAGGGGRGCRCLGLSVCLWQGCLNQRVFFPARDSPYGPHPRPAVTAGLADNAGG